MSIFFLLLGAWFLTGAMPRLRADAARQLPVIRQNARDRMTAHSRTARDGKTRKPGEWYGWAALAGAAEVTAVMGYLGRSAWHGWGDHRYRAAAAAQAYREKRAANRATADPEGAPETVPPPEPTEPPDHPGGGGDRTAPETVPPPGASGDRGGAAWDEPLPDPSPQDGSGSNLRPLRPIRNGDDMTVTAEAPDLETAVHYADRLIEDCVREVDAAAQELIAAKAVRAGAESYGSSLATAGISGDTLEALAIYAEGADARVRAAEDRVAATDASLAAAQKARDGLRSHEAAAEALVATGGAADETRWYGAKAAG